MAFDLNWLVSIDSLMCHDHQPKSTMSKHQDFQQLSLFPDTSRDEEQAAPMMDEGMPGKQHLRLISSGPGVPPGSARAQDMTKQRCIENELVNRVMFF